jgi:hypothetical protein
MLLSELVLVTGDSYEDIEKLVDREIMENEGVDEDGDDTEE